MVPRLRETRPTARGDKDTEITQPRDHSSADPCTSDTKHTRTQHCYLDGDLVRVYPREAEPAMSLFSKAGKGPSLTHES